MKTKFLRLISFFPLLALLCVILMAGCKEEESYDPSSIVGKWQVIQFPENCVGFGNKIIEFTPDSVFKKYIENELDFISTFNIKAGSMGYDTIFFHNPDTYPNWELIALKSSDTLHLVSPILTLTYTCGYFKRKN